MSDQTVINPTSATAQQDISPLESFANETASATPAVAGSAADSAAPPATQQAAATPVAQQEPAAPASAAPPFHADAPVDLDQQLATQDTLANGSASAGASAASTPGIRNDQANAPAASPVAAADVSDAVSQDISAGVKDFVQAFSFVEQGVVRLGAAAKDELIALAKKYL